MSLVDPVTLPCGWRPSPNFRARKPAEQLIFVVVHGTWMTDDEAALARLTDPASEVSAHYYLARDGALTQLVREAEVAWHAGTSQWHDPEFGQLEGLNGWSLGVEIGNAGPFPHGAPSVADEAAVPNGTDVWGQAEPYTDAQYATLRALLADVMVRHPAITPARVLPHSAVAPGRKTDPGGHFDWGRVGPAFGGF